MNRMTAIPVLILISLVSVATLAAQQGGVSGDTSLQSPEERLAIRQADFENLLEESLDAVELSDWDEAFSRLDEAELIFPDDSRITDYRVSFLELAALEDAQVSWNDGTPTEVVATGVVVAAAGNGDDGSEADADGEPKFTIDRGDRDPRESPVLTRDNFRSEVSLKVFAVDPVDSYADTTWSSVEEIFYSSIGADLYYWLPVMRKSLGFNFRSSGYSYSPGTPSIIFNSLDFGTNIRGFLAETKTSRLEIGLDFGGSFQSTWYAEDNSENNWALFLGLWASDPLFYHLFQAKSMENLLFGGGIRIYSSFSEDIFETINYRLDGTYVFRGGHLGIRLEWWDFVVSETRTNMMSLSILGGYRF